jgi:hypothetical protein
VPRPDVLRRAVRSLPAPAQVWLKTVDASIRDTDWAERVRSVRLREQAFIDATTQQSRRLPGRKRVLFLTLQTPSPWSGTECSLATALALRGHDVRGILCDGLLPLCEMNLGAQERPSCDVCSRWRARHYEGAFGIDCSRLTDDVSGDDHEQAVRLVEGIAPQKLSELVVDGVPVGRFARRELQRYYRGFVFDPAADPAFRQWLVSSVLIVRLLSRALEKQQPDIVVASSGRTLPSACLLSVAKARGVHAITWDTEPSHPDALVFAHDTAAVEIPLEDTWRDAADRELSREERAELHRFLRGWARSETTPFPYNPSPIEDQHTIATSLGLRSGAPLVVAFANSAWDMAVVDRNAGFASMFDWLFTLVEYARANPHVDLVVRAHPAETNVPQALKSRTPVAAEIRRRCPAVPPNVSLVEGDNPISSYALGAMAQVATIYSSRLGLELAMAGKRTWLAGQVTYRGKGFTRDIQSKEELVALLDARAFNETLSSDAVSRAERFAYLWFFQYVTRLPLLRPANQTFGLSSFRHLAPGEDAVIDNLCEAMVARGPFVRLNGH